LTVFSGTVTAEALNGQNLANAGLEIKDFVSGSFNVGNSFYVLKIIENVFAAVLHQFGYRFPAHTLNLKFH
jgi:hypothetical protein